MIAPHQTSKCWAVEWDTPALTQLVSEARQNSSTRSGTVSSAAIVSVVGGLAMINSAYQHLATTGQLKVCFLTGERLFSSGVVRSEGGNAAVPVRPNVVDLS
jgi:hypothetical protein